MTLPARDAEASPARTLLAGRRVLTGGEAVAHAMRQVAPDVVPVYPGVAYP